MTTMGEDDITLVAENETFTVPRSMLVKHSLYFSTAMQSGMIESHTRRFEFDDISASHLATFIQIVQSDFTLWLQRKQSYRLLDESLSDRDCCSARADLEEVLGLAGLADYLQIAILTSECAVRLMYILENLFEPVSINGHQRHECGILRDFLSIWVKWGHRLTEPFPEILFRSAVRHPNWILNCAGTALSDQTIRPVIIDLVLSILSSSLLCVSDEDQVLHLVIDWIEFVDTITPSDEAAVQLGWKQSLLDCIRPGLLSTDGQHRLMQFWSTACPQIRWQHQLTWAQYAEDVNRDHLKITGPFSCLQDDHQSSSKLSSTAPLYNSPRATTPILVGLVPGLQEAAGLHVCLFNLLSGQYYRHHLSDHRLHQLFPNAARSTDLTSHIYLCHTSKLMENTAVLLYFDPVHSDTLMGFLWCLASRKALRIPPLHFTHIEGGYAEGSHPHEVSRLNSFCSRLGVVSSSDGLVIYMGTYTSNSVTLRVFRFNFRTWTWIRSIPVRLLNEPSDSFVVSFSPINQLEPVGIFDWLYCNVEGTARGRRLPIVRHNLHQSSRVFSRFYRFRLRPADAGGGDASSSSICGTTLEWEELPPAPFLIRIYRLLTLRSPRTVGRQDGTDDRNCVGTCSRDEQATQYCFDLNSRKWITWNTALYWASSKSHSSAETHSILRDFIPGLLGFRGLVCATQSDIQIDRTRHESIPTNVPVTCETERDRQEGEHRRITLVLAGRPGQGSGRPKPSTSGIWLHSPQLPITSPTSASSSSTFEPNNPIFPLPTSVSQQLGQMPHLPTTVLVGNWENLTHASDLFHFPTNSPPSTMDAVTVWWDDDDKDDDSVSKATPTCMESAWNWATAGDSD